MRICLVSFFFFLTTAVVTHPTKADKTMDEVSRIPFSDSLLKNADPFAFGQPT
jgi:hypothetical protein